VADQQVMPMVEVLVQLMDNKDYLSSMVVLQGSTLLLKPKVQ
jgi:hypothetical protein